MSYFWSLLGYSSSKVSDSHPRETSVINEWLKSHQAKSTAFSPGGGGVHDHLDPRIVSLIDIAENKSSVRTVLEECSWYHGAVERINQRAMRILISKEEARNLVNKSIDEALTKLSPIPFFVHPSLDH